MKINLNCYASDFETTTTSPTRVWSWQVRSVKTGEIHSQGIDIDSYFDNCPTGIQFFHNLGFDSAFIYDALLRKGFVRVELDMSRDGKARGLDRLYAGQFTSLIGDLGQHYSFSWATERGTFALYDSLKKAPGTLASLGQSFGAEVKKGKIDYEKPRPAGYQPTAEEWEYLDNDTAILAHVLKALIGEGLTGMTCAGDCFRIWSEMFYETHGDPDLDKNRMDTFRRFMPVLPRHVDEDIRKAYRGGFTYVRPEMQGRLIEGGGRVYDVNSMYPSVMVQEDFPVGRPLPIKPGGASRATHPLEIRGAIVTFQLKPNSIPLIAASTTVFGASGWTTHGEEVELWATKREWALLHELYDLYIEEDLGGYAFRAMSGKELFGAYIERWMAVKATTKGAMRALAKLLLNGLWGKYSTNPLRGQKIPMLHEGQVVLKATPKVWDDPVYTAIGVFTTSYARERIVRSAMANFDRFCYADTDSLHLTGDSEPVGLEIHDSALGAWAHEGTWTEAFYCRAKAYTERMDTEDDSLLPDPVTGKKVISVAMAGLPEEARVGISPETVYDGMVFSGKLARKRVPGGLILGPVAWRLDFEYGILKE